MKITRQGFTITELASAMMITVIFALAFFALFTGMHTQTARTNIYFETNRTARFALDKISRDVKEAVNIATNWGGNTTGNTALVLKLPSLNSSGEPTNIATQFDYVTYKLDPSDSTKLVRTLDVLGGVSQREGGTDKTNVLVAKRIQSILFSYNGTGLSSISASALVNLKYVNAQITGRTATFKSNETTQVDSDLMLRNRIS
jgi:Tfp pilus assembly protein PilW